MCDSLCALAPATSAGRTLWAKNSDRPPDEPQQLEWFPPRRDEGPVSATHIAVEPSEAETVGFLGSRPTWMWGVEHGVNEAGVAAGNETIFTVDDPRRAPPGLTGMDLVRLALARAATADAAVDVVLEHLERYGQGGTGHRDADRPYWSSFLVADPTTAFVVETSGNEWAVEAVDRVRAISNRTTIAGFDAVHRHPSQPVERLVDPRWHASRRVLDEEPVTVERLKSHLASHVGGEDGWTICMHADDGQDDHAQTTNASLVAELPIQGPPVAHVTTGSPCTSRWHRIPVAPPTHASGSPSIS